MDFDFDGSLGRAMQIAGVRTDAERAQKSADDLEKRVASLEKTVRVLFDALLKLASAIAGETPNG